MLHIIKMDVYRRGDASSEARVQRLLIDIEHLDLGMTVVFSLNNVIILSIFFLMYNKIIIMSRN